MVSSLLRLVRSVCELALDFLFPPSKRERTVRSLSIEALHVLPMLRHSKQRAVVSLSVYDDAHIKDAIRVLKFERSGAAARLFAELLADFLLESEAEQALFEGAPPLLVPMPLGKRRMSERGYNQVLLVLEALKETHPEFAVRADLLIRARETAPQTTLSRAKRLKNVAGAFAVRKGVNIRGHRIILIDDVTTTGATLHHGARALERAGAKVTALALARA